MLLNEKKVVQKFFAMWHVPPSHTSAEACLTGWPNARPQAWDKCKKKVKERIVLRKIHLRTTRRHLSNGITQCYLLPDRGGRPAFTPTGQVGTRFIDPPIRMKG